MKPLAFIKGAIRDVLLRRLRWAEGYGLYVALENRIFGRKLRVETCSACQLACPSCTTAKGETKCGSVGWGILRADLFRRFVEASGRIRVIEISNWGEIFLNRELPEILAIAQERGIALEAMNGVNLNTAREEALEAVVRYGLRRMSVSIDGATQEAYAKYRVNGDLDLSIREALVTSGKAVSFTAVAMVASTLVWGFSNIRFDAVMGVLLAVWMFVSFAASETLLPVTISYFRPRFILKQAAKAAPRPTVVTGVSAAAAS